MDKKRRFRDQFLAFVISGRLLLYVMSIIEQQLVIKILLPHLTPASSTWEQSFTPHPLWGKSVIYVSLPRQWTLSNQVVPFTFPKCENLCGMDSLKICFNKITKLNSRSRKIDVNKLRNHNKQDDRNCNTRWMLKFCPKLFLFLFS